MTLPDYHRLVKYWEANPPLHLLAQAYLGIAPAAPATEDDCRNLAAQFAA